MAAAYIRDRVRLDELIPSSPDIHREAATDHGCDWCGHVRTVDGEDAPAPFPWVTEGERSFCSVKCQRERAASDARGAQSLSAPAPAGN